MNQVKLGLWLWVLVLVMGWSLTISSAAFSESQHRKKSFIRGQATSSSPLERRSSFVFPVHGNVCPMGSYNVTLNIGQPPKPYFLDLDTGSDLTWLQCDTFRSHFTDSSDQLYPSSNDFVASRDPICLDLQSHSTPRPENPERCDFELEYEDGTTSIGVLVMDAFTLKSTNGVRVKPHLALGCGYSPKGSLYPLDGVLGLGRGKTSLVSQLYGEDIVPNVFGHCLSGQGGGFLFFGDDLYESSRVAWMPMSSEKSGVYSPGDAELKFDGISTDFKVLLTIFDSGTTYSYFNSHAYGALTSFVKSKLSGTVLKEETEDKTLPLCWKGNRPFKSIYSVRNYFKTIELDFTSGGKTKTYELPPEAYLIISSSGNVCLGILNGTEEGLENPNIIGDISMQDKMVIYDNEKQMIGWVTANCRDELQKTNALSI